MKGKIETTYEWRCADCGTENRVVDDETCPHCGKERSAEKRLRHFKLTPTPIKIGFRFS